MTTATLTKVLGIAQSDRNTYNYMKRTDLLRSKVPETSPGVPVGLSKQAALEIAFISALAGAGLKLAEASERVNSEFMARVKSLQGDDLLYALNSRTGFGFFFSDPSMSFAKLQNQLADTKYASGWSEDAPAMAPTVVSVINVAELARRIHALFENPRGEE